MRIRFNNYSWLPHRQQRVQSERQTHSFIHLFIHSFIHSFHSAVSPPPLGRFLCDRLRRVARGPLLISVSPVRRLAFSACAHLIVSRSLSFHAIPLHFSGRQRLL